MVCCTAKNADSASRLCQCEVQSHSARQSVSRRITARRCRVTIRHTLTGVSFGRLSLLLPPSLPSPFFTTHAESWDSAERRHGGEKGMMKSAHSPHTHSQALTPLAPHVLHAPRAPSALSSMPLAPFGRSSQSRGERIF